MTPHGARSARDGTTSRPLYALGTTDKSLARRKLARLIASVEAGTDPREAPRAVNGPERVKDYASAWLAKREAQGVGMAQKERRNLELYVLEAIGKNWPSSIAVDDANVYWTNRGPWSSSYAWSSHGAVSSAPIDGGAVTVLAGNQTETGGLALLGDEVFWLVGGQGDVSTKGALLKVPKQGGPSVLLARMLAPGGLALSPTFAYWADNGVGSDDIFATPVAGGASAALPSGVDLALDLVLEGTNLYWSTSENQIMTLSIR